MKHTNKTNITCFFPFTFITYVAVGASDSFEITSAENKFGVNFLFQLFFFFFNVINSVAIHRGAAESVRVQIWRESAITKCLIDDGKSNKFSLKSNRITNDWRYGFESLEFRVNHPSTGAQRNERKNLRCWLKFDRELSDLYIEIINRRRRCEMTLHEGRMSGASVAHCASAEYALHGNN